jgi:alkanesulfonate monooxygenase SsuD/methylene tetrahydromethanopterin reductase-like flavin-dependent oxidoreductase (luciferase family)
MVEFGIHLAGPAAEEMPDRLDYLRELLDIAPDVYRTAWLSDHLMKDAYPTSEGWTALTYLSALAPTYRFGHLVLSQSYRNPALLAKMAVTLQYLTRGRFILGIGAGWQADEYDAYGYDFPSPGTRVEQLAEAIDVLRAMWTQSPATYEGRHYRVRNAYCEPRPNPMIPILVGGRKPRLIRVAATKADIFNWDGPVGRYAPLVEQLHTAAREAGRDPAEIALSVSCEAYFPDRREDFPDLTAGGTMSTISAAQDPDGAYADYGADFVLGPTPEDAIRELRPLMDLGASIVTVYFQDRATAGRFAREVIPAFA